MTSTIALPGEDGAVFITPIARITGVDSYNTMDTNNCPQPETHVQMGDQRFCTTMDLETLLNAIGWTPVEDPYGDLDKLISDRKLRQ